MDNDCESENEGDETPNYFEISSSEELSSNEEDESTNLVTKMENRVDENPTSKQLRRFFAKQLIKAINDDLDLNKLKAKEAWTQFCFDMSRDYDRRQKPEVSIGMAYSSLDNKIFEKTEKHIDYFPGFYPVHLFDAIESDVEVPNMEKKSDALRKKLNLEQENAYERIMEATANEDPTSKCFYLTGGAGTGKTFVYKALVYKLISIGKKVICSAPTGIAATLLPFGMTCHKAFDLPFTEEKYPRSDRQSTHYGSVHARMIEEASVIIIDEITMLKCWQLEYIDCMLRTLTHKKDIPFGGKVILAGGDFKQLMPIKDKQNKWGTESFTQTKFGIEDCVKTACDSGGSSLWTCFESLTLTRNMRVKSNEEKKFVEFLDKIGNGIKGENEKNGYVQIPEEIITKQKLSKIIFEDLYDMSLSPPDAEFDEDDFKSIAKKVILAPKNERVDYWNREVLELMPYENEEFPSHDKDPEDGSEIPSTFNQNGCPLSHLELRQYATIILLCNLDVEKGLCNGARFRYIEEHEDGKRLKCVHLDGLYEGETVYIPRINWPWRMRDYKEGSEFIRAQYPVRLAFAMTVHRAQGQTFEKVGVDLTEEMFAHGQMYVAFSRTTKFKNLKVYSEKRDLTRTLQKNVVNRDYFTNSFDFKPICKSESDKPGPSSPIIKRPRMSN